MKTTLTTLVLAVVASAATSAMAGPIGLVDDFSGDLSAYTDTRILIAGGSDDPHTWQISGGALEISVATHTGTAKQYALTRTDYTLDVGQELKADFTAGYTGMQDIGILVGAGHPTMDVRADYVNIYMRNNGQIFSRGFNGTTELSLAGGGSPATEALFIARTAASDYELGYYEAGVRTVLTTRTGLTGVTGGAIGLYADIRAAGVVGNLDNLTVIPEPASALLCLLAMVGLAGLRRREG